MNDSYEKLASSRPANTNEAELYAVPADSQIVATLYVCNQDSSTRQYRVALTDSAGAAGNDDWIIYDQDLLANITHRVGPLSLTGGETIRIKASTANVISFVLTGLKVA